MIIMNKFEKNNCLLLTEFKLYYIKLFYKNKDLFFILNYKPVVAIVETAVAITPTVSILATFVPSKI